MFYIIPIHRPAMGMRDDRVLFKMGNLKLTATNCIGIAGRKRPSQKMVEMNFL